MYLGIFRFVIPSWILESVSLHEYLIFLDLVFVIHILGDTSGAKVMSFGHYLEAGTRRSGTD